MRLLLVIVQAEDADLLVSRLVDRGLRVTRIDSVGSFLARGNATVLIGLDEQQVEEVLTAVRATCRTRTSYVHALPAVEAPGMSFVVTMPLEVEVGGAVVFSFPVKQFYRFLGGGALPAADQRQPALECVDCEGSMAEGGNRMNLVLAILQNDDADTVAKGLLAADYRVTRLNTAGGFFRRGNVTLLIGVDADKVEDVLRIMQANLPVRTEARPPETGMPAYSATVFVLEADRFVRM